MPTLGKLWAGRVYGTNTGNVFVELDSSGERVTGTVRLMDTQLGLTVYKVTGSFDGMLRLKGEPTQVRSGITAGILEITATLTPEGSLRGQWNSSIGTGGTFELYPHDVPPPPDQRAASAGAIPEQIFTSNVSLGSVRLYAKELWELVNFIRKDFIVGRPVVTYTLRGNEATKYFEDFQREAGTFGELRRIKINIQELEAHGINKVVTIGLNATGQNEIQVQGINESWVIGKAEAIARTLRPFERRLVTTYKKFGLTLNEFIFLAMIVALPSIESIWQRMAFATVAVILLSGLYWFHSKFIPNTVIYLSGKEPTVFQRAWPSILSWLSAVTASLAAAYFFYLLTRSTP
ncbi:MAG: hypothetical protein E6K63_07045 [Nitrospirae bacterium]|nr:MAG: hypothetical protein E6K63_07045 [Nitrospirota bacterium]